MKKLTKRDKFEMLLEVAEVKGNEMLVEFINHELELLNKKNATSTGTKKPTKTQVENESYLEEIRTFFNTTDDSFTISELQNKLEGFDELSNQKISALLKKCVDSGNLEKFVDKKKTYFKRKFA